MTTLADGAGFIAAQARIDVLQQIWDADPGDHLVYYIGDLACDCERIGRDEDERIAIAQLKGRREGAMRAHEQGVALLVQCRIGPRRFEYLAIRTRVR